MRTNPRGHWAENATPFAVLLVLVALDVALGPTVVLSASFAIAAVVAGALATVRTTVGVAVLAVVLAALSGTWNQNVNTVDWWIRLALSVLLGTLAIVVARHRLRGERDLTRMTAIADAAQQALLRAIPQAVGSVGFAARYVSASEAARVGGDLYEVAETPFGVRVILGDVRGKGLPAVQLAASVLAAFRRAVFVEPSLGSVSADLNEMVTAVAGDEDFVTALLAEFHDDGTVTMVNAGHHPPLLVGEGHAPRQVDTGEPQLPLGLGTAERAVVFTWPDQTRLLLFTDGLIETRDAAGRFFPLTEHGRVLSSGTLDEALDELLWRLRGHAPARLQDDIALLLAERLPDAAVPQTH